MVLATPSPAETLPVYQDSEDSLDHTPAKVSLLQNAMPWEINLSKLELFPQRATRVESLIVPTPEEYKLWKYEEKSAAFLRLFTEPRLWNEAAKECLFNKAYLRMPLTFEQFEIARELSEGKPFGS